MTPSATASAARMKENSAICASAPATLTAVRNGTRNATSTHRVTNPIPTRIASTMAPTSSGTCSMTAGSIDRPTETKNRTVNSCWTDDDAAAA